MSQSQFQPKNIMVVVDYRQKQHHALPRAAEFARKYSSRLTLVSCVYPPIMDFKALIGNSAEEFKKIEIDEKHQLLETLAKQYRDEGLEVNIQVLWHKKFYKGLIEHIKSQNYDLVVKTAHTHDRLSKLLMTPTDWHLLRETSEPLLLVKEGHSPGQKTVMGAIKIQTNGDHHDLNQQILSVTQGVAEMYEAAPQLVNVFPWPLVNVYQFKHLFDENGYFKELTEVHNKAMNKYLEGSSFDKKSVHIVEGLNPEEIIPDMAREARVDLLVMGSVGREGLAAAVVGNTAEKILDDLDCDVLVLKPEAG